MTDSRAWREQMEDLAAHIWTNRKASFKEVCDEVALATARPVPEFDSQGMLTEDALRHLETEEVRKVLQELHITADDVETASELCAECFALPGECGPSCGQYEAPEEKEVVDLPKTEKAMCDVLDEAMVLWFEENLGRDGDWSSKTFEDAQIMTSNKGLVVKIGVSEFQITVVRSR